MTVTAARRWKQALDLWAIPGEILDAASRRPFVFIPEMFAAPEQCHLSLSNRRAAELLRDGGSVLDVGCGGGSAAFAVAPPATAVIGTDRQSDMLELFAATAHRRGISATVHPGSWPDISAEVPEADVVVCHNVLYNAADISPFVSALDAHARRRVVIEITPRHPQDRRRQLWQHFWNLDRPLEPTAATAVDAIREAGYEPVVEDFLVPEEHFASRRRDLEATHWCRNLCLPPERETEVAELIAKAPFPRERIAIWWDTKR